MNVVKSLVRFSATPVFLLLGAYNLGCDPTAVGRLALLGAAATSPVPMCFGMPVPKLVAGALGSMWLMYFAMALFHSQPWLGLFSRKGECKDC